MNAYIETIREQAREAADEIDGTLMEFDEWLTVRTDAASDVWQHHVERLMGALRAAGVSDRLVEEIARGG